jgi:hypothetical protein
MNSPLSRRHFLRTSTALIALPALESLGFRRFASAASPVSRPKRMIFLGACRTYVCVLKSTLQNARYRVFIQI